MPRDPYDTFPRLFLAAYAELHPEQEYTTPRWSAIGQCARKQWYTLTGHPRTEISDGRGAWVAQKGHLTQLEVLLTLIHMGHDVVCMEGRDDNSADLVLDGRTVITGHIDAEVAWSDMPNLGITVTDSKERNVYAYMRWAAEDPMKNDPSSYLQMQGYLLCRHRAWGCYVVTAQDSAATKGEITKRTRSGKNGDVPHPALFRLFVPFNEAAAHLGIGRALGLIAARDQGKIVEREYTPGARGHWQCDYCDYRATCEADGPGGLEIIRFEPGVAVPIYQLEAAKEE